MRGERAKHTTHTNRRTQPTVAVQRNSSQPVSGGEAAARLHVQRRISQVQFEELQGGIGAEGGVQLLCGRSCTDRTGQIRHLSKWVFLSL